MAHQKCVQKICGSLLISSSESRRLSFSQTLIFSSLLPSVFSLPFFFTLFINGTVFILPETKVAVIPFLQAGEAEIAERDQTDSGDDRDDLQYDD